MLNIDSFDLIRFWYYIDIAVLYRYCCINTSNFTFLCGKYGQVSFRRHTFVLVVLAENEHSFNEIDFKFVSHLRFSNMLIADWRKIL